MLNPYPYWSLDGLTRSNVLGLIGQARQLRQAAASPAGLPALLRGKNLALISSDLDGAAAAAFHRAATELGAQVARIDASAPEEAQPRNIAALLGQLYDAVECQGLPDARARQLAREAGVPVFNGIAEARHATGLIADLMTLQDLSGGQCFEALQLPADAAGPAGQACTRLLALVGAGTGAAAAQAPAITATTGPGGELPLVLAPASPALDTLRQANRHHLLQALLSSLLA